MSWVYLVIAGLFEMFGVETIKRFTEKKNIGALLLLIITFGGSFLFLALALKQLSLGVAYAVWTGLGTAGGAILGIVIYGESKEPKRLLCILLIIVSVIGLKLVG
jgi:paired small multidrug resistance pump